MRKSTDHAADSKKSKGHRRFSKRSRTYIKRISLVLAAVLIFLVGLNIGNGRITIGSHQNNANKGLPNKLDYSSVDELYKTLKANFDGQLDANKLIDGAKQGLVKSAGDPYTEYLNADDYKAFNSELTGTFTGIGAELSQDSKGNIVVIAPIAGFPAEKAGIKPKDIIAQIDDKPTTGMTVSEAVDKIRGPKGTTVKLKVVRGNQPLDFTITRDDISVPSVKSEVKNGVGYLTISRFGDDTADLANKAAQDFKNQNVKAVVVDLRSDPGGLLDAAVAVSSLWVPEGKTVLTERRDGIITQTYKATGGDILNGIPTVAVIDGGSASASEITAGALHDNGVAKLAGTKSYGKGSVQQLLKLNGGGVLKVTVARWYTPDGKNIDKAGITPDFVYNDANTGTAPDGSDLTLNQALSDLMSKPVQN